MIKQTVKRAYLWGLSLLPHNNIYEFHHISSQPSVDLSPRKIDTKAFYAFIEKHGPYLDLKAVTEKKDYGCTAAITFDDGLVDVYETAYAFLKEKGFPFTVFLLSGKIGQPGYVSLSQAREMAADPLVTIGSHGTDHTKLSQADEKKQRVELKDSKRQLEDMLGIPCETFAYPFGMYNEITLRLVREADYQYAYAVKGRPLLRGNHQDPYTIPRLSIGDETVKYYARF